MYWFYVVRPIVPKILEVLRSIPSLELAEEMLVDEMCLNREYQFVFYPKNWYSHPRDTIETVALDVKREQL